MTKVLPPRVRIDGRRFYLDESSPIDPRLFFGLLAGYHESSERELAGSYLRPDIPLVDLGAGLGTVSICTSARLGIPFVVACEPNPRVFGMLRRNMAANMVDGVAVCAGVWYSADKPRLALESDNWTSAALKDSTTPLSATAPEVKPTTLSALVSDYLQGYERFQLVCDIEGGEWELFRREAGLLKERCLRIVVELHEDPGRRPATPQRSVDELLERCDAMLAAADFRRAANIGVVAAYVKGD